MKKHFKSFLLMLPLFLGVPFACQDRLDIVPLQTLSPELALKTEGDLVGVLIGAYDGLQSTSLYGGDIQLMGDLWANRYYLRFRGTFNGLLQIASVTTTSNLILLDNAWARDIWGTAYETINTCNLVLENLSLSEGNLRAVESVEGEALFIRGSLYFELARLYGRTWGDGDETQNLAVPIILTSTPFEASKLTPANYPARSTVAQVYAQAEADLIEAAALLPETNQHYATKWAALAQLSRIALMKGDYVAARDYSNQVIESGYYSITQNFDNLYYNFIRFGGVAPSEYIYYTRITTQDGTNGLNTYYGQTVSSIPGTAGRGDLDVQTPFINLHETGDVRRSFFIQTNRRLTQKHLDRYGHVPVIRLAEMYLTRAEANFRLGTSLGDSPLNDINAIRDRAGLAALSSIASVNEILNERRFELAFEGHLLHDLKRTRSTAAGSNNTNGPTWDSQRLIFPIPQREMDVNVNLIQNEIYTN
jgi:starch-binding outer membrane protein, SusD/RagB family